MAKTQVKRMDWFKWFPRDIQSSRSYQRMTPFQRSAYRDMLDECWINFEKGCGIELDPEWLALAWGRLDPAFDGGRPGEIGWKRDGLATKENLLAQVVNIHDSEIWKKEMPDVIRKFRILNGLLVNDKLLSQVDETLEVSTNALIRRSGRTGAELEPNSTVTPVPLQSVTPVALESDNKIREDKRKVETEQTASTIVSVFNEMAAEGNVAGNTGRAPHTPGYYKRGQYPGTSPKAIFSHIAKAWSKIRGDAAVCRYPSKYPENWELLCDNKSGDLLVPAFELWAVKHGYNTEWPLTEFIKVAQQFMEQVIPLNEVKPKITAEQSKRIDEIAKAQHETVFADPVKEDEAPASAFLEE